MKHVKLFENFRFDDIENNHLLEDGKFKTIIEYYCAIVESAENDMVILDIPVDIYFNQGSWKERVHKSFYSKEKQEGAGIESSRHINTIKAMWMSLSKQHFREFKDKPYFLVKLYFNEPRLKHGTRDEYVKYDNHAVYDTKSNELLIDEIYNYVMDHEEVLTGSKYNL
jgi:hypothetical protein